MFFFIFSKFSLERSDLECASPSSSSWILSNADYIENNLTSFSENSMAFYESNRNRKKFSIDFCGNTSDSYFVFSNSDTFEDMENSDSSTNLHIHYLEGVKKYSLILSNKRTVVGKKEVLHKNGDFCFTLISGRGYVGVFSQPYVDGKEPLILTEMNILRNYKLVYVSKSSSYVRKLCIGDFLGENRHDYKFDTDWDNHMRDFL